MEKDSLHWINRAKQLNAWLYAHNDEHPDWNQNVADLKHAISMESEKIVSPHAIKFIEGDPIHESAIK